MDNKTFLVLSNVQRGSNNEKWWIESRYMCHFLPGIKKKLIRNDSSKNVDNNQTIERAEKSDNHVENQGEVRFEGGQLVTGIFQTNTSVDQVFIYFVSYYIGYTHLRVLFYFVSDKTNVNSTAFKILITATFDQYSADQR